MTGNTVLISGASIGGPALAYWLNRYGFRATIVEKAGTIRTGGYPIDLRGVAIEVMSRMGLLPQVRHAHIATRQISVVGATGKPAARVLRLLSGESVPCTFLLSLFRQTSRFHQLP